MYVSICEHIVPRYCTALQESIFAVKKDVIGNPSGKKYCRSLSDVLEGFSSG